MSYTLILCSSSSSESEDLLSPRFASRSKSMARGERLDGSSGSERFVETLIHSDSDGGDGGDEDLLIFLSFVSFLFCAVLLLVACWLAVLLWVCCLDVNEDFGGFGSS